jgi:hypothetical protein
LSREVRLERFAGEETVQPFAEVDVGFSVEEYPGVGTHEVFGNWHNAWFDKSGGVKDFACQITVGGEDNESASSQPVNSDVRPRRNVLMEDRYTT